jgi:hypothetical protein
MDVKHNNMIQTITKYIYDMEEKKLMKSVQNSNRKVLLIYVKKIKNGFKYLAEHTHNNIPQTGPLASFPGGERNQHQRKAAHMHALRVRTQPTVRVCVSVSLCVCVCVST